VAGFPPATTKAPVFPRRLSNPARPAGQANLEEMRMTDRTVAPAGPEASDECRTDLCRRLRIPLIASI